MKTPGTGSPEDAEARPSRAGPGLAAAAALIERRGQVLALTGAGCSTASGIPDYRGPDGRLRHARPIQYRDFVGSEHARRRYWARSMIGWPSIAGALPNPAHRALAAMEEAGFLHQLVTQNVDGLHQRAGHRRVVDLHGRLGWVDCLECGLRLPRAEMQRLLATANPGFGAVGVGAEAAPDGDAAPAMEPESEPAFAVPGCPACGGILKPAVVFFGENVPRARVDHVRRKLRASALLLVVGSSLTVYSGFRFCREAAELGIPILILNRGQTRADDLAAAKLDGEVGAALGGIARLLRIPVN